MDSKINAAWHKVHPMPKNATTDQRIKWHLSHIKNCKCRNDIPAKLKEEMLKKRNRYSYESGLKFSFKI